MFRAIITMMDVPTAMGLLAPRVQRLGRGGALLIFSCCLLMIGPLCYLWWRYDLRSTWYWFGWLLDERQTAEASVRAATTSVGVDAGSVGLILMLFGVGFTLLPSAIQIGLARFVQVPALGFLIKVSLGFDLITDWGPIWELASNTLWFDTAFGWAPLAWAARLVATCIGAVMASVVIQSATILVAAMMLYLVGVIVLPQAPGRAAIEG